MEAALTTRRVKTTATKPPVEETFRSWIDPENGWLLSSLSPFLDSEKRNDDNNNNNNNNKNVDIDKLARMSSISVTDSEEVRASVEEYINWMDVVRVSAEDLKANGRSSHGRESARVVSFAEEESLDLKEKREEERKAIIREYFDTGDAKKHPDRIFRDVNGARYFKVSSK